MTPAEEFVEYAEASARREACLRGQPRSGHRDPHLHRDQQARQAHQGGGAPLRHRDHLVDVPVGTARRVTAAQPGGSERLRRDIRVIKDRMNLRQLG